MYLARSERLLTSFSRLFNHFFTAFSHVFGCSFPIKPPPTGETGGSQKLSLAYVHKYMDLNYTCLGHFINQLGHSAAYFGFSQQDSQTFVTNLNSQFNVRCSPPITVNPAQGPQLLSLCQHESCPLAAPSPDCAAYANLQPGGYSSSVATQVTKTTTPSFATPSSTSEIISILSLPGYSSTTLAAAPQFTDDSTSKNVASTEKPAQLSAGAIAGIAISSAVVFLMAVALALYYFKNRRPPKDQLLSAPAFQSPASANNHTSRGPNQVGHWSAPPMMQVPIAEMESPLYGYTPQRGGYESRGKKIYPPKRAAGG